MSRQTDVRQHHTGRTILDGLCALVRRRLAAATHEQPPTPGELLQGLEPRTLMSAALPVSGAPDFTHEAIVLIADGPEVDVRYASTTVADGDQSRSLVNGTNFGTAEIGSNVEHTYTVHNLGTTALTLGTPAIVGPHAGDFTIVQPPATSVNAGGSTSFTVRFAPSASTPRYAGVAFTTNDTDEAIYNFAIFGQGIPTNGYPSIEVLHNSTSIADGDASRSAANGTDFGHVAVGDTGQHTFYIRNLSEGTLNVGSAEIAGPGADDFSVSMSVVPLGAYEARAFTIVYAPTVTSTTRTFAGVRFTTDDPDAPIFNFGLTGTAKPSTDPDLAVYNQVSGSLIPNGEQARTSLMGDFGPVDASTVATLDFRLDNTGTSTLNISSIDIVGPHAAAFTITSAVPTAIAGGGSQTITIRFDPIAAQDYFAGVHINTDEAEKPVYSFALGGRGTGVNDVPQALVTYLGTTIPDDDTSRSEATGADFGTAQVGGTVVRRYRLENTGTKLLSFDPPAIVGPHAADFVVDIGGGLIRPGEVALIPVEFTPTAATQRYAGVKFTTNDYRSPEFNFSLTGRGVADAGDPALVVREANTDSPVVDGDDSPSAAKGTDLGNVLAGIGTLSYFRVYNQGTSTLNITGISFSGEHAADLLNFSTQPMSISAGSTGLASLRFTPGGLGRRTATVTFTTDDPMMSTFSFDITAVGV